MWSLILAAFSHLFMVVNSSMNILFYCVFNSQFRAEARKALAERQCFPAGAASPASAGGLPDRAATKRAAATATAESRPNSHALDGVQESVSAVVLWAPKAGLGS